MNDGRKYRNDYRTPGRLTPRQAFKALSQVKDIPAYLEARGFHNRNWRDYPELNPRSADCPVAQYFSWETGLRASVGPWDVGFRKKDSTELRDELALSLTADMTNAVEKFDKEFYSDRPKQGVLV